MVLMLAMAVSCHRKAIYSHYEPIDTDGWQRDDTLHFTVTQIADSGYHHETLGLRANLSYPFTAISLIVRQQTSVSGSLRCDTVMIGLIDSDGRPLGRGISHFQYDVTLEDIFLCAGDTLSIDVRHNMKREDLPGITDIGLTIEKI